MSSARFERIKMMLKETPGDPFLLHAAGIEQAKTGNDESALEFFQKVLESDTGYVGTYYHLAKCLERLHKPEEAAKYYHEGMKIAQQAGDMKTFNELQQALEIMEDE